jgi:hypothetical protein
LRGRDIGLEEGEQKGPKKYVREKEDEAADAEGEPEIGGAHEADVAEEPVFEFAVARLEEGKEGHSEGEGGGVKDGESRALGDA